MLLTVFCLRRDRSELTFSLQVDADFELQNFRALCELESGIPAAESQVRPCPPAALPAARPGGSPVRAADTPGVAALWAGSGWVPALTRRGLRAAGSRSSGVVWGCVCVAPRSDRSGLGRNAPFPPQNPLPPLGSGLWLLRVSVASWGPSGRGSVSSRGGAENGKKWGSPEFSEEFGVLGAGFGVREMGAEEQGRQRPVGFSSPTQRG